MEQTNRYSLASLSQAFKVLESARDTAMRSNDQFCGCHALLSIAATYITLGAATEAHATFDQTRNLATSIKRQQLRDMILKDLVIAQLNAGFLDAAISTTYLFPDVEQSEGWFKECEDSSIVEAFTAIAVAQWHQGQASACADTVLKARQRAQPLIDDSTSKPETRALFAIALGECEIGKCDAALRTAKDVSFEYKDELLSQIAMQMADQGQFRRACKILDSTSPDWHSQSARNHTLLAQFRKEGIIPGVETNETLIGKRSDEQFAALAALVQFQAEQGDIVGALRTLALVKSTFWPSMAAAQIILAQVKAGDLSGAISTTSHIYDSTIRNGMLNEITKAQTHNGDIAAALATVGKIKNPAYKADALSSIGIALAQSGDRNASMKYIRRAIRTAVGLGGLFGFGIRDPDEKFSTLLIIADAQAQINDCDGAIVSLARSRRTARRVVGKGAAVERFAAAMVKVVGIEAANAHVSSWHDFSDQAYALNGIARGLIELLDAAGLKNATSEPPVNAVVSQHQRIDEKCGTQMNYIISNATEAPWNNQKDAVKKRKLIENTWHVRFRALTLSEWQAQELASQTPLDGNFHEINDEYLIRLSTNSIFIHEFGVWTDPGYVMFFYQTKLYYVNVALGVHLTTALYNRTDTLSHMAKILLVLEEYVGVLDERKRLLIVLEGDLTHRVA